MSNNISILNLDEKKVNENQDENEIIRRPKRLHENENNNKNNNNYLNDTDYDLQFDYNNPDHLCKKQKFFHNEISRQN
jgi:hypothetical protein